MASVTDALVDKIAKLCEGYKSGQAGAREGLIENCTKLLPQLMTPEETMVMTTWAHPTHNAAVRLGVDMGLFQGLAAEDGKPKSSREITDQIDGAEQKLVARMLRHMATMGTVLEIGPDFFAPSAYALALGTKEMYREGIEFVEDDWQPLHQASPLYFRENGFKSPPSAFDSPFQVAYNCKGKHLFEFLSEGAPAMGKPLMGKKFGSIMQVWSTGRPKWFREDYYPVRERLLTGQKEGQPFFVDVGGNMGHDVQLLKAAFGNEIHGELVNQDRPDIIGICEEPLAKDGIKAMAHDFMTEQPVKGARAYYFHSIIQDWDDPTNQQILRSIVPAMEKGYSKILINDYIVPNQGAHWQQTSLDWQLMVSMGARHRTNEEIKTMVAGIPDLKITGIWKSEIGIDSLVEIELA